MDTIKVDSKSTLMIAHRGLSGIELENTNAAFIAAGNRSHFGIETDTHVTKDGKFVIIHDDNTDRVSSVDAVIEETDFETLRSIRLCHNGDNTRPELRIPTLKEYINNCKRYDKVAVLEIKNQMTRENIADMINEIKECEYLDKMIYISFAFDNLVYVREILPEANVQFLVDDYDKGVLDSIVEHDFDLDIRYTSLTKEIVDELHSNGRKINCWTVNEKEDAERLIDWGIDFITSNILE